MEDASLRLAEFVARDSYGRMVAYLAARSGDVIEAEDAVGEALLEALRQWPSSGVPANPDAWLLTVARRRIVDTYRRSRRLVDLDEMDQLMVASADESSLPSTLPERRLGLLFACAHPAIQQTVRTPLMLQAVLGLTAEQIASCFVVSPQTMSQRLVRAKIKIRDAGIRFEPPGEDELDDRLDAVLEAIYAAYTTGWHGLFSADMQQSGLADEAVWLGRLIVKLMPDKPEPKGLLALMLFCESRRAARRTQDRGYVPMSEQNTTLWDANMIGEAEQLLFEAVKARRFGGYQLEAALQSAHVHGRLSGVTDWQTIVMLYDELVRTRPTIGALVSRAAALAEGAGVQAGMDALSQIPADAVATYQPFWAVQSHVLRKSGDHAAARLSLQRAIGLTDDAAIRRHLMDMEQRWQQEDAA